MAPLFALIEVAAAAIIVVCVFKKFHARRVSPRWWISLGFAVVAGTLVGWWFGFQFSYQPAGKLVVYSFPLPGAFHVLESYNDGTHQWIDFVTPAPFLVAVANASLMMSLFVAAVFGSRCLAQFGRDR